MYIRHKYHTIVIIVNCLSSYIFSRLLTNSTIEKVIGNRRNKKVPLSSLNICEATLRANEVLTTLYHKTKILTRNTTM